MRKTVPAIAAAILLAAFLAGCSAEEGYYPENSYGLTYGNGLDIDAVTSEHPLPSGSTPEEAKAWMDEYYPDLMAVSLDDGTVGYSYVDDIEGMYPAPANPEDAAELMGSGFEPVPVPVYDLETMEIVGWFGTFRSDDGASTGRHTTTISVGKFSVVVPANLEADDGLVGTYTTYADGCIGSKSIVAKNADGTVSYVISEVGDRGFDAVREWALGLPESATDQPGGKAFGLGEGVKDAVWDEPVFYEAAGGEGIAVSYVLGDARTTYHFVDLGDGYYAEVKGVFPEAAYAEDPEYFDYAFYTIATDEWMDAWTGRG